MDPRDPDDAWDDEEPWVDDPEPGAGAPPPVPGQRAPQSSISYRTAPRSVDFGGVISESLRLFGKNFLPLFGFALLFFSGFIALNLYAKQIADVEEQAVIQFLSSLAAGLGGAIQSCLVAHFIFGRLTGSSASVSDSLGPGLSRLGWVLLANLLIGISVLVGLVLLIVPGVFIAIVSCVAVQACVIERIGPIEAIRRSANLTKGSRWLILGIALLIGFAQVPVALPGIIVEMSGNEMLVTSVAAIESLLAVALGNLTAVGATVLYVRLRRAHGEDPGREMEEVFD